MHTSTVTTRTAGGGCGRPAIILIVPRVLELKGQLFTAVTELVMIVVVFALLCG